MNPVSLYFHIPFCKVKCIYCDFYSVINRDHQIPVYVDTLLQEFQQNSPSADLYDEISTIYLGGGTPSMLAGNHVEQVFKAVSDCLPVRNNAEITLEANPGEMDLERLTAYRAAGINRISFGIQSFHNKHLEKLGRLHRSGQNAPSVEMAREAGFTNISVDLIFHLPYQSISEFEEDLRQILQLDVEHISIYSLTVERNTPLFTYVQEGRIQMTPDDVDAKMFRMLCHQMKDAGYHHYEVSNFARPGYESQHNSNYWNGTHYYSYGPSAHSYNGDIRWWNIQDLSAYFSEIKKHGNAVEEREFLDESLRKDELLLTRLRTARGLYFSEWHDLFHEPFPGEMLQYFQKLEQQHPSWIDISAERVSITEEGWLYTDSIIGDVAENVNYA